MTDASLRGDCPRCIGLCCVALAFDRGPLFAVDKAGGEQCRNLCAHGGCGIHEELAERGFAGCANYDCRGAGQLTTELFAGLSWRDGAAVARQMFAVFSKLSEVQTMRALLGQHIAAEMEDVLAPRNGWTLERAMTLELGALRRQVRAALSGRMEAGRRMRSAL